MEAALPASELAPKTEFDSIDVGPWSRDPVALIVARGSAPGRTVGGLTLVERLVRSLELEGVRRIVATPDQPTAPDKLGARLPHTHVTSRRLSPDGQLSGVLREEDLNGGVLVIDGTLVVDRRVLRALIDVPEPCVVAPLDQTCTSPERVRLGRFDADQLELFDRPLKRGVRRLDPSTLPTFSEEMRGATPIILRDCSSQGMVGEVEQVLIHATQKQVMDAPARWLDPPIENAIVRRIASSRITPNQVSLVCTLLGFIAAAFLWNGWFVVALPLMFLVGWLDGVDGKLARLRLEYSRLGSAESFLDFAYENAWWIALTAYLAHAGHWPSALWFGAALVGGNLLDEIAYTIGHVRLGKALDLLSPADATFRLIAGRRNIYVVMLTVAILAGSPFAGLVVTGCWAVITGLIHTGRLIAATITEGWDLGAGSRLRYSQPAP